MIIVFLQTQIIILDCRLRDILDNKIINLEHQVILVSPIVYFHYFHVLLLFQENSSVKTLTCNASSIGVRLHKFEPPYNTMVFKPVKYAG